MARPFGITMKVKDLFFDRQAVQAKADRAKIKNLSKAGAFIRRGARSSIRRRKAVSAPGQPPSAHSKDRVATIKNILFGYDAESESVVVGPVLLNGHQHVGGVTTSGTTPETLEFGRTVGLREKRVGKSWRSIGRRRPRPGQPTRIRRATYRPRPFMGPALAAESETFPDLWFNSVR